MTALARQAGVAVNASLSCAFGCPMEGDLSEPGVLDWCARHVSELGATGNVCTEEIVHALQLMGHDTGVDLGRLLAAARRLPGLIGHDVPSQLLKAGRRLDLHPLPTDFAETRTRAEARG